MTSLNELCWICACHKDNLQYLSYLDSDEITYYVKLTSSVPELYFKEMNEQGLICRECCDNLNVVYNFRQKCFRSKTIILDYLSQQHSVSNINDKLDVHPTESENKYIKVEELFIKTERNSEDEEEVEKMDDFGSTNEGGIINNEDTTMTKIIKIEHEDFEAMKMKNVKNGKKSITLADSLTIKGNGSTELDVKPKHTYTMTIYECNICNRKFTEAVTLSVHMRTHSGEKPHECYICHKKFNQSGNLTKHIRTHTGEQPFQCKLCKKKFNHSSNLTKHMRVHTGDQLPKQLQKQLESVKHQCAICNKTFNQASNLYVHIRTHTGEKRHECNICNKKFNQSSNLAKHMRIHTGDQPFECNVCNKKFGQSGNLAKHLQTHSSEKPYECSLCDKKFNHTSNLSRHLRLHTGEKLHECNICGRKFSQNHNLFLHMRTHTGEKPHICNVCNKNFNHSSNLARHMQLHIK